MTQRMDTLRGLLFEAPSMPAWEALTRLFDDWPPGDPVLPIALEYASQHLDAWPAPLRRAPAAWLRSLIGATPHPALGLARAVRVPDQIARARLDDFFLELATSDALSRIEVLDLRLAPRVSPEALELILGAPAVDHLEHLYLPTSARYGDWPAALESAKFKLRTLNFAGDRSTLQTIFETGVLDRVEELSFGQGRLGDAGAKLIAERSPASIAYINLTNNAITETGGLALARMLRRLGRPIALAVSGNPLGDHAMAALIAAGAFTLTRDLYLQSSGLGPSAAHALAEHLPRSEGTRTAWLEDNPASVEDLNPFLTRHGDTLDELSLDKLDDADCVILMSAFPFDNLQTLRLRGSFGALGAEAIRQARGLPRLDRLEIRDAPLGDKGVAALARAKHLPALGWLSLIDVGIGEEGALALTRAPFRAQLFRLSIEGASLSRAAASALMDCFGEDVLHLG